MKYLQSVDEEARSIDNLLRLYYQKNLIINLSIESGFPLLDIPRLFLKYL